MASYDHNKDEHFMVRGQNGYQCVCRYCPCRNHSCPRLPPRSDFTTSYQQQYKGFSVQPVQEPPKVRYQQRHYNPEVLSTNYKQTYLPVHLEEPTLSVSRMGTIGRQILKSEPFVGDTAYKQQYKPFKIQNIHQEQSPSRLSQSRTSVKFEGESSYKSQFHELPIPKLERYKHPEYKNSREFQGSSSYKQDFPTFKVETVRAPERGEVNRRQVKFEGSSTYSNHYGTFKVEPVGQSNSSTYLGQNISSYRQF